MISEQDLCSPHQVSVQDPPKSLGKILVQAPEKKKGTCKISLRDYEMPDLLFNLGCRHAHGHFTISILCQTRIPQPRCSASLCSQMHMLCGNLQEKCQTLLLRPACCASLRGRQARGHFTRATLCGTLQEKHLTI